MDILLGGLVAIVLVALCVGFGLAVRSVVDKALDDDSSDRLDPDDRP
jgi:hypothetical protein